MKTALRLNSVVAGCLQAAALVLTAGSVAEGGGSTLIFPGADLTDGNLIPSGGSIGNTVIINSGDIPKNAYGAVAGDGQTASENQLFMHGGSVMQLVGA